MKILIVYASAGAGHKKCAEALYEALRLTPSAEHDIKLIDSLDYSSHFFKWLYGRQYITLINYLPLIWGFFYYSLDNQRIYKLTNSIRRLINGCALKKFERFLCDYQPDVVIATHFMTNEIVSYLKQKGRLNCRLVTAVTDFKVHSFWIAKEVDTYAVAAEKTMQDLIDRGVDYKKIAVTGVAVSPKFEQPHDKKTLKKQLGLEQNLFIALIIGGGFGVGPLGKLTDSLVNVSEKANFIVVCGKNKRLFTNLQKKYAACNRVKIFGFTERIHQLMSVSDVLISKSGGMTTSEALTSGLAMIVLRPIPGQESGNCKALVQLQAAVKVKNVKEAKERLTELITDPTKLMQLKNGVSKLAKPNSAKRIIELAIEDK